MNADYPMILVGSLIAGGILICLVAVVGGLLHGRSNRLLAHAERMKALEMGRDLPSEAATARGRGIAGMDADQPDRPAADKCFSVAGKACLLGFVFAVGAANSGSNGYAVAIAIAAATGAIGVTSVICGTVLAARTTAARGPSYASAPRKPYYDPEAV